MTITIPARTTWYWQLSGTVKTGHSEAKVYDIDAEDATPALVAELKRLGHIVIGYYSAGTYEAYRDDADSFPKSIIGNKLSGWNENYIDIRAPVVKDIMAKRLAMAKAKGFDGVEPDVIDAYQNHSGFSITKQDQIDYALWTAQAAHDRGMIVAQKNVPEMVNDLVNVYDFCIAEESFAYHETGGYRPYIGQGKAVLAAEYTQISATKCARAKTLGFSLAFYNLDLNGRRYQPC